MGLCIHNCRSHSSIYTYVAMQQLGYSNVKHVDNSNSRVDVTVRQEISSRSESYFIV